MKKNFVAVENKHHHWRLSIFYYFFPLFPFFLFFLFRRLLSAMALIIFEGGAYYF